MNSLRLHGLRAALLLPALLVCALFGSGCGSSSHPQAGGATNWLRSCHVSGDCGADGSCICGLCSEHCANDGDCSGGLVCQSADSALVRDACGSNATAGLCAPLCRRDADCTRAQSCVEGACAPAAEPGTDAGDDATGANSGAGTVQGRTPQAYVLSALLPDTSCVFSPDNATYQMGKWDIGPPVGRSEGCEHSYHLHLKVASDEPGALQLSGATIKLMDVDQKTLQFTGADPALPNPLTYLSSTTLLPAAGQETVSSIYEVEVVPARYAPYLKDFDGKEILAEIRLQARDADDAPIAFRPFVYRIELCSGCLTICLNSLTSNERQDITAGYCDDNAGSDGRVCFDPGC